MATQEQKGAAFRALHEGEPFLIPNPWDAGTAKVMAALGFKALATTSGGFAFSLGRLDGQVTLDEVMAHTAALAAATEVPLSVDMENGYGPEPEQAALAITRAAEAGAVGGSIEDYDPGGELYGSEQAVERVSAAAEAARALDFPFTFTARAENHLRGNPDVADTIARLQAFEAAGADVLYAPWVEQPSSCSRSATRFPRRSTCWRFRTLDERGRRGQALSGSASGASSPGSRSAAMAEAAQRLREDGDFGALAAEVELKEWLSG